LRSHELSERQKRAWDLYQTDLTVIQIGMEMGCTPNAASKLVAQAKEKLGIGLEK